MNRFFGGLLIAVGAVIALLSGLCTVALGFPSLLMGGPRQMVSSVVLLGVVGGAPFLVGVGLAILGYRMGWGRGSRAPGTRAARRIVAMVMIALGGLIAFGSFLGLASSLSRPNPLGLVMGLIGILIGAGLAWGGVVIWRDPPPPPTTDVF